MNLASYQLTKQMSSFSRKKKKTLLRMLLFRVQTKQTPVHNNKPANDPKIYTQHGMNVDSLAINPRFKFLRSLLEIKSSEFG